MFRRGKLLPACDTGDLLSWPLVRISQSVVLLLAFATTGHATDQVTESHWAFTPLHRPAVPDISAIDGLHNEAIRNDIDRFVVARLHEQGLRPSLPAENSVLLRRLSFDLLGLPPTPKATREFSEASSLTAYAKLVDQLLQSPHFGERWARHWLDVVRYGQSDGFERNKLTAHAWRYRDWVIQALNSDMPYDEFIRLQLAGDVLGNSDPLALIATGMLVVGPYDEIGNSEGSLSMRMMTRQTELAELVGTITQTFLALTVDCARCHDHKFDPTSQVDYYRMAAMVAGVKRANRPLDDNQLSPQHQQLIESVEQRLASLQPRLKAWLPNSNQSGPVIENYHRQILKDQPLAYWRLADQTPQHSVVNQGTLGNAAVAHATGTVRYGVPGLISHSQNRAIGLDGTAHLKTSEFEKFAAGQGLSIEFWLQIETLPDNDYVNLVGDGQSDDDFNCMVYLGKDRKLRVHVQTTEGINTIDSGVKLEVGKIYYVVSSWNRESGNLLLHLNGNPVSTTPVIGKLPNRGEPLHTENPIYIGKDGRVANSVNFVIDEVAIYDKPLSPSRIYLHWLAGTSHRAEQLQLLEELPSPERSEYAQLLREVSRLEAIKALPSGGKTLAVKPVEPDPTYLLARGDFRQPGEQVAPGVVETIQLSGNPENRFTLSADAPEAERRITLVDWLTDPGNPLVARVIVNRLWQYHFGTGLVRTPNDFGLAGEAPSHPQLLDWLASELVESGWRLKHLHRLIVNSATYRQSSQWTPEGESKDRQNRWLWRYAPRRLDGESLRDAMLFVSGELNPIMGGPGYQDFHTTTNGPVHHRLYRQHDGVEFDRRTIYRTWVRASDNPLLNQFDCPDPSVRTPQRAVTTTPTQALTMLNNVFAIKQSEAFARRVQEETVDTEALSTTTTDPAALVRRAYELAFCRLPSTKELKQAKQFTQEHGLAQLCLVLFNANEFLYVD